MRKLAKVLVCAVALFPVIGCNGGSDKAVEVPKETVAPPPPENLSSQPPADVQPMDAPAPQK